MENKEGVYYNWVSQTRRLFEPSAYSGLFV